MTCAVKLPLTLLEKSGLPAAIRMINEKVAPLERGEARSLLETEFGVSSVWDDESFSKQFAVNCFAPPFVSVIRIQDGVRGTVLFTDKPRFYFGFKKEGRQHGQKNC